MREGRHDLYCFALGTGAFVNGPVADGLDLVVDTPRHGVIAPPIPVTLSQFQADLAKTRDEWVIDEA